jgi:hypothetical protein
MSCLMRIKSNIEYRKSNIENQIKSINLMILDTGCQQRPIISSITHLSCKIKLMHRLSSWSFAVRRKIFVPRTSPPDKPSSSSSTPTGLVCMGSGSLPFRTDNTSLRCNLFVAASPQLMYASPALGLKRRRRLFGEPCRPVTAGAVQCISDDK